MPSDISDPIYEVGTNRWRVRWVDDEGRARSKRNFRSEDAANEFRMKLFGPPVPAAEDAPDAVAGVPAVVDGPAELGSAHWWDEIHTWFANELVAAVRNENLRRIDVLSKAIRSFSTLAQSQTGHRDVKKLEIVIKKLQAKDAEIAKAQRIGARAH